MPYYDQPWLRPDDSLGRPFVGRRPLTDDDELGLDLTDPDTAFLVDVTLATFVSLIEDAGEAGLHTSIMPIVERRESPDTELVLTGEHIATFIEMVFEIMALIDKGASEDPQSEEYYALAEGFMDQMEDVFPDVIQDLRYNALISAALHQQETPGTKQDAYLDTDAGPSPIRTKRLR